jgi:chemotaxis protein methyltransferase CheR
MNAFRAAEMSDRDFGKISRLVYEVCGINLTDGKKELLKARLGKLIRRGPFGSFRDYYEHVVKDSSGEALVRLLDAVSTNFTSFFREPQHFEYLKADFLPGMVARKNALAKKLRFWSAGCSSGNGEREL